MEAVLETLKRLDWSPLYISIKTGIVATFISFFLGIFAARKVLRASDKVRAVADGILTMPLVLPPTVAGFFLLLFFSRRRPLGILLYEGFGIKVVQSWLGCIIAATVIAFPLKDLLDSGHADGGTGNSLRNDPDFCQGYG